MAQIHASAKQGNGIIRSLYDSNEWKYKKFVKKKKKSPVLFPRKYVSQ
jgi:hypothetical protein